MSKIPNGWQIRTLGSLAEKPKYGWTTSATDAGEIKLLRTTDLANGPLNWDGVPFCKIEPKNFKDYEVKDGDIFISRAGSVGVSALIRSVPFKSVFASYLIRIRPTIEINSEYLAHFMNSPQYWEQIKALSSGITLTNINASKIQSMSVPVPPIDEQIRIVEILEEHLSRIDSALEDVKQAREKADQFRRSLLHAAFTGQLTDDYDLSLVNNDLSFDDAFDVGSSAQKSIKKKSYLQSGAFPVVDQGEEFISGYSNDQSKVLNFQQNVIIFGDHTRRLKYINFPFIPGADGTKIILAKSILDSRFAFFQLQSKELRNKGYARHFSELRKEKFCQPPLSTQKKIVEILEEHLSRVDSALKDVDRAERTAAQLRRSLLHAAFTGQLTKEDANV